MWQVISASQPGTSHLRIDLPCQDAHSYRLRDDCVIAAIADGLGSAARSEMGAKLVVETALNTLEELLEQEQLFTVNGWEEVLQAAFAEARQSLEQAAQTDDIPLREYGTTLIIAVVTPEWLAVGHLGDGAVVVLYPDETLETISTPQQGEYANEVKPLTDLDALEHTQLSIRQASIKAVALLTDGLQTLSIRLATGEPYAPFFIPFFTAVGQAINTLEVSQRLASFLDSERVCAKTDDDKTLLVIGRIMKK